MNGRGKKRTHRLVAAAIALLLAGAVYLGIYSVGEMKQRISEDFNAQQLALARHAATILEQDIKIIKKELRTLGLSPSIQYVESVSWKNRMKISLSSVREYGVFRITLIDADGISARSVGDAQVQVGENSDWKKTAYFYWSRNPENRNEIHIGDVQKTVLENNEPGLVMKLAIPVYQVSPDEAHPAPTRQFSGVLVFFLDAGHLAKRLAAPIRSGKTGYAWVIDGSGNFLYHLERRFVGQNAFEARQLENPHISFTKINLIQRDRMLQGQEGTAWYISGWHRGDRGPLKKLIAFAPVHIEAANVLHRWSVAVVAPISEVQDAIQAVYLRQAGIQIVFGAAIFLLLMLLRSTERGWYRTLETEVKEKTRDLADHAKRLKESEERYRSIVESADDLIFVVDARGVVLSMNDSWHRMTEQEADSAVGRSIFELVIHRNPEAVKQSLEKALAAGAALSREEFVEIAGRSYWFDTKYTRVAGTEECNDEGPQTVLMIARDITEQKRIEQQLFNTQKLAALGELAAGVAHEINNPLAIILGFTEILLEKAADDKKSSEILKVIERQGNNCKRIVENLLAFGRLPIHETAFVDVAAVLEKTIEIVESMMLTRKIELKTWIPEDLSRANGNVQELEQVFLNIINNAVAAMENGGDLTILAENGVDSVRIHFRDSGIGISKENMERIFEPFFTTKNVGEGTGLGLSVSYGIVKKFGGDIEVVSQTASNGEPAGSAFTVVLPAVVTDDRPTARFIRP